MNQTIQLMEHTSVSKAIIKLALPTMLGMVAQSVYNLTDTFFISMTGDPNMVAAVSLSFPLFMVTQGIGSLFAIGSASYISRKLGEKNMDEARRTNAVTFYITIIVTILLSAAMLIAKTPLLRVIGTSEGTFGYTDDYFTVVAIFATVMTLNIAMQGLVRSEGATMHSMIGMVLGIAVNIVLDPIFILVFGWGTAGAAYATVIGAAVSCLYYILFFNTGKSLLSIRFSDVKPNRKMLAEILKIGVPAGLSHIVITFCAIINNVYAAGYGDHVVAAAGITMRVCSLSAMLVMGIAMGFQPFAGYNYGAGNYQRLIKGLKLTILYSTCIAVFFAVVTIIFRREILLFFIDDAATVDAGTKLMFAFVLGMPFFGMQNTFLVTFQALGKPFRAFIMIMGRQCLFFLPLLLILTRLFGFNGYVYTQPIADFATTAISLVLAATLFKNLRELPSGNQLS